MLKIFEKLKNINLFEKILLYKSDKQETAKNRLSYESENTKNFGRPKKWDGYETKVVRLLEDFIPLFEEMTSIFVGKQINLNDENTNKILNYINKIK